jgi:hypothetical protein
MGALKETVLVLFIGVNIKIQELQIHEKIAYNPRSQNKLHPALKQTIKTRKVISIEIKVAKFPIKLPRSIFLWIKFLFFRIIKNNPFLVLEAVKYFVLFQNFEIDHLLG